VQAKRKIAGCIVLSCADLVLCLSALLLAFAFNSPFAVILFMVVLPVCLLLTVVYVAIDLAGGRLKQAAAAVALLLPTLAVQIWFYRNLDL